jgi:predicted nucleic acid-binding protein
MTVFVDANIVLEVLMRRSEYVASARILRAGEQGQMHLCISSSAIGFVAYWLRKEHGLAKTKEVLIGLLESLRIVDISHEYLIRALSSDFTDIEDAIQYYTALQHNIEFLITLDKKGFKQARDMTRVMTPRVFLRSFFPE